MKRNSKIYLKDILQAIEDILEYSEGYTKECFREEKLRIAACMNNFTILGEAIAQLDTELKEQYDQVPWQKVKDFRNVIVHKYFNVDYDIFWDVIENKLENLHRKIKVILQEK